MSADDLGRRAVVSVSVSRRTDAGAVVAAELDRRGVPLTSGGALILQWAAAYLSGAGRDAAPDADAVLRADELAALLDQW